MEGAGVFPGDGFYRRCPAGSAGVADEYCGVASRGLNRKMVLPFRIETVSEWRIRGVAAEPKALECGSFRYETALGLKLNLFTGLVRLQRP